ncbi:MAG: BatD family protein [Rudaea sp.]
MIRWTAQLGRAAALMLVLVCCGAHAATVRAWLDRNAMQLGETVTLNVEVSDDASAVKPDFSTLESDFNLSGTQSSSSINIINGQSSSKMLWAVALEPKRAGVLTIPPISIAGQTTQPIALTVQATAAASGKSGDDVYIETSVEPRSPYVQQQVSMTVKLYFAVSLVDGALDDPQADGVVVHKVGGQDSNFAADVGGRRYRVLERRYVLQAEKSGAITLPAITFRGHAMDRADMNSFFNRGRSVTAHSEPINLDVRARPANSGTDAWLPAQSVTLAGEGVDSSTAARVGDPLTLTLRLQATGLGFEQLPELNLPKIDGADIYPDKATTQNRDAGDFTVGLRERKFAIVPNRAGHLVIPSISVAWWDTAHDRAELATVPELALDVQPAAGGATPSAPLPAPNANIVSQIALSAAIETPAPLAVHDDARIWQLIAFVSTALWMITLIVLMMGRRRARRAPASSPDAPRSVASEASAKAAFRAACGAANWPDVARALLAWAHARHAEIRNLRDLAKRVEDPRQVQAIDDLESVIYGRADDSGLQERLSTAFREGPALNATSRAASPSSILPPLYPAATRTSG